MTHTLTHTLLGLIPNNQQPVFCVLRNEMKDRNYKTSFRLEIWKIVSCSVVDDDETLEEDSF